MGAGRIACVWLGPGTCTRAISFLYQNAAATHNGHPQLLIGKMACRRGSPANLPPESFSLLSWPPSPSLISSDEASRISLEKTDKMRASLLKPGGNNAIQQSVEDDAQLAEFGYGPELKRSFGLLGMIGFA